MSRRTYHKPRCGLCRSQRVGTLTSKTITSSTRPPWRLTVWSKAQLVLPGACNHTTGRRPLLLRVSRPRCRMLERLRAGVACLSFMAESSLWGERGDALCRGRGRLEEVPLTERCQAIDVLALAAME